jgi:hypothetical protein
VTARIAQKKTIKKVRQNSNLSKKLSFGRTRNKKRFLPKLMKLALTILHIPLKKNEPKWCIFE